MSPRKRKASSSRKKVTIQVEAANPNVNPVVVSFPGGLPESIVAKEGPKPKFLWQKLNHKTSSGRKVTGEDKHCVYSGLAPGLAYDDRCTKLVVGVYDRKRGVVVLKEAASRGTVFAMEQGVPAYIEKNGPVENETGKGMLTYNTQLFQDFGTAKKQKVLRSQAASQVDINHVVGAGAGSAVMNNIMRGASMSESNRKAIAESTKNGNSRISRSGAVDTAYEAARRNFLPKYDETAVKPHKVYSARDIAGDTAWTRVYNKVHASMHDDDPVNSLLESINERDRQPCAEKLVRETSMSTADAKERLTCAILLNHIIRFYLMNSKRRSISGPSESRVSYFRIPMEVATRLFALFTTTITGTDGRTSYAMSKQNKDKLMVHALLMYMMAQGTTMKIANLKLIADDMKTTVTDCGTILRQAGCTITKKGTTISAALKTPLKFPPPKRGVGRGR